MSKSINLVAATAVLAAFPLERLQDEARSRSLPESDDPNVLANLLARDCRSLQEFATTVVNVAPTLPAGKDLTPMLRSAFPDHDISDRHGPHYMSKVRAGDTGRIQLRAELPSRRVARVEPAKVLTVDLSDIPEKSMKQLLRIADESTKLGQLLRASQAAAAKPAEEPKVETPTPPAPSGIEDAPSVAG